MDAGDDEDETRTVLTEVVRVGNLGELRTHLFDLATRAGLDAQRAHDFAVAVNEAAGNVIRHGGGNGEITVVQDDQRRLIAEICDNGPGIPTWVTVTLPTPHTVGGRGLWMADALTDHMEIHTDRRGTVVRLEMALDQ